MQDKPSKTTEPGDSLDRRVGALPRFATLTTTVRGRYSGVEWKEGDVVKVTRVIKGKYCIERVKRRRSGILREGLPILNELCNVPRQAITFHGKCPNKD